MHLREARDHVRRGEHRALKRAGDERLTGSKYLWLQRSEDMTAAQRTVFRRPTAQGLKVGRA
jgi:hypothetical protein